MNFMVTQVSNKTSRIGLVSMLLLPLMCVVVRSAKQFRLHCTLESLQWRQWRDRLWHPVPDSRSGNGEGTVADGLVQRPWNVQQRCRWRSQASTRLKCRQPVVAHWRGSVVCACATTALHLTGCQKVRNLASIFDPGRLWGSLVWE